LHQLCTLKTKIYETKITILLSIFISTVVLAQPKADSWKELKEFHSVMAATFHPSEDNNLTPIKSRAGELNEKAIALQSRRRQRI
jgi:hypothetical protein